MFSFSNLKKVILLIPVFWILSFVSVALGEDHGQNPFTVSFDDSLKTLKAGESLILEIKVHVPDKYFVYKEKTSLVFDAVSGLDFKAIVLPEGEEHFDKIFSKNTKALLKPFSIKQEIKVASDFVPKKLMLTGLLTYQGCSDDFCYRPEKKKILIPLEVLSLNETKKKL